MELESEGRRLDTLLFTDKKIVGSDVIEQYRRVRLYVFLFEDRFVYLLFFFFSFTFLCFEVMILTFFPVMMSRTSVVYSFYFDEV